MNRRQPNGNGGRPCLPDSTNGVIWEADARMRRFTYVSPQAERIFGYPTEAWYREGFWSDRVHPDDRNQVLEARRSAGSAGTFHELQYRMVRADGSLLWIHDATFIRDTREDRLFRGCLFDITAAREGGPQTEESLAELIRVARASAVAGTLFEVAGDLSDPLQAAECYIGTCLRKLRQGRASTEELVDLMQRASEQTRRAGRVVRDAIEFARRNRPVWSTLNLSDAVREVLALVEPDIRRHRVHLRHDLAAEIPGVLADAAQIKHVLLEMIWGAIDRMNESAVGSSELRVETHVAEANCVECTVRLPGSALMLCARDSLSEPSPARRLTAAGIGLSTCQRVLEVHGGRFWVTSSAFAGAAFHFQLPSVDKCGSPGK